MARLIGWTSRLVPSEARAAFERSPPGLPRPPCPVCQVQRWPPSSRPHPHPLGHAHHVLPSPTVDPHEEGPLCPTAHPLLPSLELCTETPHTSTLNVRITHLVLSSAFLCPSLSPPLTVTGQMNLFCRNRTTLGQQLEFFFFGCARGGIPVVLNLGGRSIEDSVAFDWAGGVLFFGLSDKTMLFNWGILTPE